MFPVFDACESRGRNDDDEEEDAGFNCVFCLFFLLLESITHQYPLVLDIVPCSLSSMRVNPEW